METLERYKSAAEAEDRPEGTAKVLNFKQFISLPKNAQHIICYLNLQTHFGSFLSGFRCWLCSLKLIGEENVLAALLVLCSSAQSRNERLAADSEGESRNFAVLSHDHRVGMCNS